MSAMIKRIHGAPNVSPAADGDRGARGATACSTASAGDTPQPARTHRPAKHLFLFIGAEPSTDWLAPSGVALARRLRAHGRRRRRRSPFEKATAVCSPSATRAGNLASAVGEGAQVIAAVRAACRSGAPGGRRGTRLFPHGEHSDSDSVRRLRGMPGNGLAVGPSAALPDVRARRLLRQLAEPPRDQAFPPDPPSDHRRLRSPEGWAGAVDESGRARSPDAAARRIPATCGTASRSRGSLTLAVVQRMPGMSEGEEQVRAFYGTGAGTPRSLRDYKRRTSSTACRRACRSAPFSSRASRTCRIVSHHLTALDVTSPPGVRRKTRRCRPGPHQGGADAQVCRWTCRSCVWTVRRYLRRLLLHRHRCWRARARLRPPFRPSRRPNAPIRSTISIAALSPFSGARRTYSWRDGARRSSS